MLVLVAALVGFGLLVRLADSLLSVMDEVDGG